jgi:hypothetical protein
MHLVQQNTFDIQCSSPDFGKEIQNQLGSLLENKFYPKLEILFDKYAIDKHTWNIDLMTLELPDVLSKNWKNELIHHSLLQVEEYLKRNIPLFEISHDGYQPNDSKEFISNEQHLRILFFHFLRTGTLADNSFSKNLSDIVSKIEITKEFLEELIKNLIENATCFERWIFSIPESFKKTCIESFVGFQLIAKQNFHEIIENQKTDSNEIVHFKQQFQTNKAFLSQWFEVLEWTNYIQKKHNSKELIFETFIELSSRHWGIFLEEVRAIFKIINANSKTDNKVFFQEMSVFIESYNRSNTSSLFKNDFENTIEKPVDFIFDKNSEVTKPKSINIGETQFITNAGLVILHPFLHSLFEQLNLCKNDIWTKKMNQHKAILLTQFMITGQEKSFENELFLNKILCGFPFESVVNTQLKITKKEKEKCYSLLQAVSEYWKVMQKSSVEALQESFLQRNGKIIIQSESRFELWVEEKGFDILLEQLPWGIGMVKTPWMEEYLICNWS